MANGWNALTAAEKSMDYSMAPSYPAGWPESQKVRTGTEEIWSGGWSPQYRGYVSRQQWLRDLLARYTGAGDWATQWFMKNIPIEQLQEGLPTGGDIMPSLAEIVQRRWVSPEEAARNEALRKVDVGWGSPERLEQIEAQKKPWQRRPSEGGLMEGEAAPMPSWLGQYTGGAERFEEAATPLSAYDWARLSETQKQQLGGYMQWHNLLGGKKSWADYLGGLERQWSTLGGARPKQEWAVKGR